MSSVLPSKGPNSNSGKSPSKGQEPCDQNEECKNQPLDAQVNSSKREPERPITPPKSTEPTEEEKHTLERKRYRIELVTVILEALGILGLFIYCLFTVLEWRVFDSERQTMEEEFRAAGRKDELEQRAWLSVIPNLSMPYSENIVGMTLTIRNSGKTPGMIETVERIIERSDEKSTNLLSHTTHEPHAAVAPKGTVVVQFGYRSLGQNEFVLLRDRKLALHFTIRIVYRDVFQNVRHTDQGWIITGKQEEMGEGNILKSVGPTRMD